ncbi:putative endonuclease [Parasphingorhabdus marina DSM 22363]|uniref:Putative endonuclease n=1 Tax=Parasphingorhabdus marina DSM 22363 TaxID=1123272 RepID=A0A1N6CR93_9SPHN|nr:GIY-YIG nuclease family protein [Parasphingorhabdus marina]SIN61052.1 putative endonuclease [Parasphingorhabdus marina DSM 22363]
MTKPGYVYIMANKRNGTIYLGVASDLPKRIYEHRNGLIEGFTQKYGCKMLVWFEQYDDLEEARAAELRMKNWNRQWKLKRIERMNPEWRDLWDEIAR